MPGEPTRERVVILGGGVAAMVAAYELSRPELEGRYDISVYQVGWRLGGKGASGRGAHERIEEHGLHVWLGFYENAFRVMRECYKELGRDPSQPLARWDDAFKKSDWVGLEDFYAGAWGHWMTAFSENDRVPGVPDEEDAPFTMWWYFRQGVSLLADLFESVIESASPRAGPAGSQMRLRPARGGRRASAGRLEPGVALGIGRAATLAQDHLFERIASTLKTVSELPLIAVLELLERMDDDAMNHDPAHHEFILSSLEAVLAGLRGYIEETVEASDQTRRLWQLSEVVMANLRGVIRHGLLTHPDGLDAIDQYDYREWLALSGAPEEALRTPFVKGLYDLVFAYHHGDPAKPAIAAGVFLRNVLRMFFTYKGAIFWKMQAGMGDTVFAPFYEVLKRRGVHFRFFHRVENLGLSDDRRSISSIDMTRQVELLDVDSEYEPLVNVRNLLCWPAEPIYEQLREGEALRDHCRSRSETLESFWTTWDGGLQPIRLEAGKDFDQIVFGVSLGSVPFICKELITDNRRWAEMVEHVATVQTEAFQIWLRSDLRESGWTWPSSVVDAYVEPFDTWADMSHLLARESWAAADKPLSIHYFCNTMPGPDHAPPSDETGFPHEQVARAKADALGFMRGPIGQFLPNAVRRYPDDFRWELLCGAGEHVGELRFDSQYWRANVDPSERYVQSVPGSSKYRMKADQTGYDNLTIAGDWTDCGVNAGCVEAAVISGMLAAHAVSGSPTLDDIVGYIHP